MTDIDIIKAFGGASQIAKLLKIAPPAIAYWKKKGIPPLRLIQLKSLRPELFNETDTQTEQPTVTITSD